MPRGGQAFRILSSLEGALVDVIAALVFVLFVSFSVALLSGCGRVVRWILQKSCAAVLPAQYHASLNKWLDHGAAIGLHIKGAGIAWVARTLAAEHLIIAIVSPEGRGEHMRKVLSLLSVFIGYALVSYAWSQRRKDEKAAEPGSLDEEAEARGGELSGLRHHPRSCMQEGELCGRPSMESLEMSLGPWLSVSAEAGPC